VAPQRLPDQTDTLTDFDVVPGAAVLISKQDESAGVVDAGVAAGVGEQDQPSSPATSEWIGRPPGWRLRAEAPAKTNDGRGPALMVNRH